MRHVLILIAILLPLQAFADCNVPDILAQLRPGAEWTIYGNDVSSIVWKSVQVKPTAQEILDAIQTCRAAATTRAALKVQARLDVKNAALTQAQRLQALLIVLDLDQ